jgi:hypothetical protein
MAGPIVSICTSSRAVLGLYKHFSFGQGQTDVSERGIRRAAISPTKSPPADVFFDASAQAPERIYLDRHSAAPDAESHPPFCGDKISRIKNNDNRTKRFRSQVPTAL